MWRSSIDMLIWDSKSLLCLVAHFFFYMCYTYFCFNFIEKISCTFSLTALSSVPLSSWVVLLIIFQGSWNCCPTHLWLFFFFCFHLFLKVIFSYYFSPFFKFCFLVDWVYWWSFPIIDFLFGFYPLSFSLFFFN